MDRVGGTDFLKNVQNLPELCDELFPKRLKMSVNIKIQVS